jgi:hypothetical protein
MPHPGTKRVLLATAVLLAAPMPVAGQLGETRVVVSQGASSPDGNGLFSSFGAPSINNAGQVAFAGSLTETSGGFADNFGIFRFGGSGPVQIAREGQIAPDGNGILAGESPDSTAYSIDESGRVGFFATWQNTTGGTGDRLGVYLGEGGSLTQIVRSGQVLPGFTAPIMESFGNPAFNNAGEAGLNVFVPLPDDSFDRILIRTDGTAVTQLARAGESLPDGSGPLGTMSSLIEMNDAGQVAFNVTDAFGFANGDFFRASDTAITPIARIGQQMPNGHGVLGVTGGLGHGINAAGEVAFQGFSDADDDGFLDTAAVYRGNGETLVTLAATGMSAPDGNGTLLNTNVPLGLNDAGQALFYSTLGGTAAGDADDAGLFLSDGVTLRQVVREGQPAPASDGTTLGHFAAIENPFNTYLNEAGGAALLTNVAVPDGDNIDFQRGLFYYDPLTGLRNVARVGDEFDGSTISRLELVFSESGRRLHNALNDLGQVAYTYGLADGRAGVAIWTPEPVLPGDANFDGVVNLSDFLILRRNFGEANLGFAGGDFNGDGTVNLSDFLILRRNFGQSGDAPSFSMIPEPAALGVLALPLLHRRRRTPLA